MLVKRFGHRVPETHSPNATTGWPRPSSSTPLRVLRTLRTVSQEILLCADNDGVNKNPQPLLSKAAITFAEKGINVWQSMPADIKTDFNDVLLKAGKTSVKNYLDNPVLLEKVSPQKTLQEKLQDTADKLMESSNKNTEKNQKKSLHKIIEKIKALHEVVEAAEQQPYAYLRVAAKEAFEKQVLEIANNKALFKQVSEVIPEMKTSFTKIIEQEKVIQR